MNQPKFASAPLVPTDFRIDRRTSSFVGRKLALMCVVVASFFAAAMVEGQSRDQPPAPVPPENVDERLALTVSGSGYLQGARGFLTANGMNVKFCRNYDGTDCVGQGVTDNSGFGFYSVPISGGPGYYYMFVWRDDIHWGSSTRPTCLTPSFICDRIYIIGGPLGVGNDFYSRPAPSQPTLSPANNAVVDDNSFTIRWTAESDPNRIAPAWPIVYDLYAAAYGNPLAIAASNLGCCELHFGHGAVPPATTITWQIVAKMNVGTYPPSSPYYTTASAIYRFTTSPACSGVSISPQPPVSAGTALTFTPSCTGSALQYNYWLYHVDTGTWDATSGYTSGSWTWALQTGTWQVGVWVRNAGSTSQYDAIVGTPNFNVSAPATPTTIQVFSGSYGANCGAAWANATWNLAPACNGQTTCSYSVNYGVLGDPVPGCAKDFWAQWACGRDPMSHWAYASAEAGLGSVVTLQCP